MTLQPKRLNSCLGSAYINGPGGLAPGFVDLILRPDLSRNGALVWAAYIFRAGWRPREVKGPMSINAQ